MANAEDTVTAVAQQPVAEFIVPAEGRISLPDPGAPYMFPMNLGAAAEGIPQAQLQLAAERAGERLTETYARLRNGKGLIVEQDIRFSFVITPAVEAVEATESAPAVKAQPQRVFVGLDCPNNHRRGESLDKMYQKVLIAFGKAEGAPESALRRATLSESDMPVLATVLARAFNARIPEELVALVRPMQLRTAFEGMSAEARQTAEDKLAQTITKGVRQVFLAAGGDPVKDKDIFGAVEKALAGRIDAAVQDIVGAIPELFLRA